MELGKVMTMTPSQTGYAPVNGLKMYYESYGSGEPLILLHGAFGMTGMFSPLLPALAEGRQVIVADLQAHGRTADIDRPLAFESLADDVAALITYLGFEKADVMGFSVGGGVALKTAIQHPERVKRLIVVSFAYTSEGWYPEIQEVTSQITRDSAPSMQETPMFEAYAQVAPQPDNFAELCQKLGDLERQPYDWADEVRVLSHTTLLVFGDADSVPPSSATSFFELLGGGRRDGGWDGSGMSQARLAILPGQTHYTIADAPVLASTVTSFLDSPVSSSQ